MKKKNLLLPVVLCTAMLMTACSGQTLAESSIEKEPIETVAATEAPAAETPAEAPAAEETATTTEAEAAAPAENSENTVTEASGAITQDRAMDAVLNYFKADFYVTELVPGIIDEEQKTGKTFNVNDYIN